MTKGRLLECNPAFRALLGYEAEELVERMCTDLVHPDDRAGNLEQMRRLYDRESASFETENRYLRKDGKALWVRKFVSLQRDSAGKPNRLLVLITDTTAHRELEQNLRDAGRRKDEFLAMLAHELRNPLAPIRNALHVLRRTGGPGPTSDRLLEMMDRQVDHLVRLVDDLMDMSRITQGKIELRKEPIDLAEIVDEVIDATRPSIDAAHHALDVVVPPAPVWVEADHVRIVQVLDNLLSNAIKYMDPGGQIRVTLRQQDGEAVLSVRDHGIGIQPDMLARVFDLFVQSDRGSAQAQSGLGLGLALVRRLTEMHGGQVEVTSEGPGKGSEFSVRLPLAPAPGPSATPAPPPTALELPRRVLIVDDNRDVADSMAVLLDMLGIEVRVAYDGPDALQALDTCNPEVILLDLGMPGMDGFETARRIRQHPKGRSPILIALTGWGQEQDQFRSREAGFDHHLVKPVDLDLLESVLGSLSVRKDGSP